MDVKLVEIDSHSRDSSAPASRFFVRVTIEIDGSPEEHEIEVIPNALPGVGVGMLVPSERLSARFQTEQYALHRICKIVGRDLHGQGVHLPQQIAA